VLDVNVWTNHLIGRDRELAVLGSLLDEAVVDGATLLTGEPGAGKTALLAAAAEMAATAGFEVIRGGGVEYETDVSFAGLHQLVARCPTICAVFHGPVAWRWRLRSALAPALPRSAWLARGQRRSPLPENRCRHVPGRRHPAAHLRRSAPARVGPVRPAHRRRPAALSQLTAFLTSATIVASSALVSFFRA
jgi:hypothetical protein